MARPSERDVRFVAFLERLLAEEDRAALAALRRGLGRPGGAAEMYRFVVPWLPPGVSLWEETAYYLVASLFAWHQWSWKNSDAKDETWTNLGASFARLAGALGGVDRVEARFVALLNSHREDLPERLRHVVGLLRSGEVPIDWAQLLQDLKGWDWESRAVQRAWARAFWSRTSADVAPADEDRPSPAAE